MPSIKGFRSRSIASNLTLTQLHQSFKSFLWLNMFDARRGIVSKIFSAWVRIWWSAPAIWLKEFMLVLKVSKESKNSRIFDPILASGASRSFTSLMVWRTLARIVVIELTSDDNCAVTSLISLPSCPIFSASYGFVICFFQTFKLDSVTSNVSIYSPFSLSSTKSSASLITSGWPNAPFLIILFLILFFKKTFFGHHVCSAWFQHSVSSLPSKNRQDSGLYLQLKDSWIWEYSLSLTIASSKAFIFSKPSGSKPKAACSLYDLANKTNNFEKDSRRSKVASGKSMFKIFINCLKFLSNLEFASWRSLVLANKSSSHFGRQSWKLINLSGLLAIFPMV